MIKAFIADDEPKVCKLIQKLIDWDAIGISVIGIANDGIDAYKQISEKKPDIVITDICMPGYDGIELISKICNLDYPCHFIIISGYRDFVYAHSAIEFGVEEYLLKPINKAKLTEALVKICKKIESACSAQDLKMHSRISIQQQYITNLISRSLQPFELTSEYCAQLFDFSAHYTFYQSIILKIDNNNKKISSEHNMDAQNQLFQLYNNYLMKNFECLFMVPMNFGFLALIGHTKKSLSESNTANKKILNHMIDKISPFNIFHATLGAGEVIDNILDLRITVYSAIRCIYYRMIHGTNRLIDYKCIPCSSTNTDDDEVYNEFQFVNALSVYDYDKLRIIIEKIKKQVSSFSNCNIDHIIALTKRMLDTFLMERIRPNILLSNEKDIRAQYELALANSPTIDSLFSALEKIIINTMQNDKKEISLQQKRPILIAQQYITENYGKKITLEEVSSLANFSPAYFSTMFKKETGMKMLDYLTLCRINAAKKLLKQSDDSISSISMQVGFSEQKYFSKKFSKIVGVSPSKFRSLYS